MTLSRYITSEFQAWVTPSRTLARHPLFILAGIAYIIIIAVLGGLRLEHWYMAAVALLDIYNEQTRRFFFCFLGIVITGIVCDSMRYYYWEVVKSRYIHVGEIYYLEKMLFGVTVAGKLFTLNEYFETRYWAVLDLLCGSIYLTFVLIPIFSVIGLFLFGQDRLARLLSWSFLLVNCLGYTTWMVYPVAPPWYVSQYGSGPARLDIHPNAAAAHRFDELLGTNLVDYVYKQEVAVFGSYPSLHVSYPVLIAAVVWSLGPRFRWLFYISFAYYALMCFSAVYLQHHYIIDVIAGTGYGLFAVWVVDTLDSRWDDIWPPSWAGLQNLFKGGCRPSWKSLVGCCAICSITCILVLSPS